MARASFKFADGSKGGLGIQDGNYEVVKSTSKVHQFPPNKSTGVQGDPFVGGAWTLKKLNENWEPVADVEDETEVFRIGGIVDFHPGQLSNPDDLNEEPEDLGVDVDTEGNALYVVDENKKIWQKCNWFMMIESLEKNGFKPEINGRGCFTDYVGMKLHVKKIEVPKYKGWTKEENPTALVCDRINAYPYEKKAKPAGKIAPKSTGAVAGKANGAAKPTTAAAPASGGDVDLKSADTDPNLAAIYVLSNPTDKFKAAVHVEGGVKRADFQKELAKELMQHKLHVKLQKPILEGVKDDDTLVGWAGEVGFMVDTDEGTVTFA